MSERDEIESSPPTSPAIRGGAALAAGMASRFGLRLIVLVVLARLLAPEDFGLIALVSAIIAMGMVFQDLGLSAAVVQRTQVSAQAVSTLFWINTSISALATFVFAAATPVIAAFYNRTELLALCPVVALTFLLNGIAVQHRALLQRHQRFTEQARIEFASAALGSIGALLAGWLGWSYWALVMQVLVTDLCALVLLLGATRFVPAKPVMTPEVREMLAFGIPLFGFSLLGNAAQNLHIAVLGRTAGAAPVGEYTRGFALATIAQGVINLAAGHVALGKLSRARESDAHFADFYYKGIQLQLLTTAPVSVIFAVWGDQVAHIVYGHQWLHVGALLQIFALGMLVQPLVHSCGQVYVSRGDTRRVLYWGTFSWIALAGFTLLGLPWGIVGVAWGWSIGCVLLTWPCLAYAYRNTPLTIRGALAAVAGPFGAAAGMALTGWLTRHLLNGDDLWVQLPLSVGIACCMYLLLCYFVFGQRLLIRAVISSVLGERTPPWLRS